MQIEIPYEVMKQNYPQYLKKTVEKFQKKGKPFDEKSLKYEMHWIQSVKMYSTEEMGEIVMGRRSPPKTFQERYDSATVENIREYFGSDIHWWITVSNGRSYVKLQPDTQLPFPAEIAQAYIEPLQDAIDEHKRVSMLTPEEKKEEARQILQQMGYSCEQTDFIFCGPKPPGMG